MGTTHEWDMADMTPADLRPGEFTPPEEGTYHLAIAGVNMHPVNRRGDAKNGIELKFEVLAGSVEGQEGRTFAETFYWPSPSN